MDLGEAPPRNERRLTRSGGYLDRRSALHNALSRPRPRSRVDSPLSLSESRVPLFLAHLVQEQAAAAAAANSGGVADRVAKNNPAARQQRRGLARCQDLERRPGSRFLTAADAAAVTTNAQYERGIRPYVYIYIYTQTALFCRDKTLILGETSPR